jgi:hypothetical protein
MSTVAAMRVLFVLGVVNAATGLALFLTCRCLPTSKIGRGLMARRWFVRIYKYHCYLWWIFWASVIIHAVLALKYLGWPF